MGLEGPNKENYAEKSSGKQKAFSRRVKKVKKRGAKRYTSFCTTPNRGDMLGLYFFLARKCTLSRKLGSKNQKVLTGAGSFADLGGGSPPL